MLQFNTRLSQAIVAQNKPKFHFLTPSGSFGTYPKSVREEMRRFQDASEARPDSFIRYEYSSLLDKSREAMGKVGNLPFQPIPILSPYVYQTPR